MNHPKKPLRRFESDQVDIAPLKGRIVSILGYGNQGHAHAQNLADSGIEVIVGARRDGVGARNAQADGFRCLSMEEAAAEGDILMLLLPDEIQGEVFRRVILPAWKDSAVLGFAHGFAVAFGEIQLPPGRSAFLAAPKGQGHMLRRSFRAGGGLPGLVAVEGSDPEAILPLALAYLKACGALVGGAWLTTFREEAVTDQFGEQAVLCGGMIQLITAAWETLVARGYSPEVAYFECLHEVKLIADLVHSLGVDGMRERISSTAAFGGLKAGPRVISEPSRKAMEQILDEIESGAFARDFLGEQAEDARWQAAAIESEAKHPMQAIGRTLRYFLEQCRLHSEKENGPTE